MLTATEQKYLTVTEIAERYNFGSDTVLRWIKYGVPVRGTANRVRLQALRFGKWYRVHRDDLEAFLKEINPDLVSLREEEERAQEEASACEKRMAKRLRID